MTIIIKSNVAANDPAGLLPIYTEYGITRSDELLAYANQLKVLGYAISGAEFAGLDSFINTLKAAEIWLKIIEIYPIIGNNIHTAAVKLKSATVNRNMSVLGDFNNDDFEYSAGRIVGKKVSLKNNSGFNTGLKAAALNNGYGLHVYTQEIDVPPPEHSTSRLLWGATQTDDAAAGTYVSVITGSSAIAAHRLAYRSALAEHTVNTKNGGVLQAVAKSNGDTKVTYNGGVTATQNKAATSGADLNRDLFLFARNGYGVNADAIGHYKPAVRFALLTDGTVTDSDNAIIQSTLTSLMSKLGRSFS